MQEGMTLAALRRKEDCWFKLTSSACVHFTLVNTESGFKIKISPSKKYLLPKIPRPWVQVLPSSG